MFSKQNKTNHVFKTGDALRKQAVSIATPGDKSRADPVLVVVFYLFIKERSVFSLILTCQGHTQSIQMSALIVQTNCSLCMQSSAL